VAELACAAGYSSRVDPALLTTLRQTPKVRHLMHFIITELACAAGYSSRVDPALLTTLRQTPKVRHLMHFIMEPIG
jgi:hypothetical protein